MNLKIYRIVLISLLVVSSGVMLWSVYNIYTTLNLIKKTTDEVTRGQKKLKIAQNLIYLDEVLTESARAFILTVDSTYLNRYNLAAENFYDELEGLKPLVEKGTYEHIFDPKDSITEILFEVEAIAFEFIENGDQTGAYEKITSTKYIEAKKIYLERYQKLLNDAESGLDAIIYKNEQLINETNSILNTFLLFTAISFLVLVTSAWTLYSLIKSLRSSQLKLFLKNQEYLSVNEELLASNEEYLALNEELKESNDRLEVAINNLEISEKRFKTLFDNSPIPFTYLDNDGNILSLNNQFVNLFGYTREDIPHIKDWWLMAFPEEKYRKEAKKIWWDEFKKASNGNGLVEGLELVINPKKGANVRAIMYGLLLQEGIFVTFIDITEKSKFLEKIQDSEQKYRNFIENSTEGVVRFEFRKPLDTSIDIEDQVHQFLSDQFVIAECNNSFAKMYGFKSQDQLIGKKMMTIWPDSDECTKIVQNLIECEYKWENKVAEEINVKGEKRWFMRFAKSEIKNGFLYNSWISQIDITNEKRIEQALKENDIRLENALAGANAGTFMHDISRDEVHWDKRAMAILGLTNNTTSFKEWLNSLHPEDTAINTNKINEAFENGDQQLSIEYRKEINGITKYISAHSFLTYTHQGKISSIYGMIRDISERKSLEQLRENYLEELKEQVSLRTKELQKSNEHLSNQKQELENALRDLQLAQQKLVEKEKMASLGVLTAGIAHEINNPINFIQSGLFALDKLNERKKDGAEIPDFELRSQKLMESVQTGVERVTQIIKGLNAFSHSDKHMGVNCSIHRVLDNCALVLHNKIKYRCKLIKNYKAEKDTLVGNEGKLHQVFLNLINNAIQAVDNKGIITIATSNSSTKNKLIVSIEDNGKGIPSNDLSKIFDPFFTTKKPGEGTGLGMSIVYGIIQEHKGNLKVDSIEGKGTKVVVTIPR